MQGDVQNRVSVVVVAGIVCLSYEAYGWAAFFWMIAALNLVAGRWISHSLTHDLPLPDPALAAMPVPRRMGRGRCLLC